MLSLVFAVAIHNLMPAFWQAWSAPSPQRVAEFKKRVVDGNHFFYTNGEFDRNLPDKEIAKYLDGLAPKEAALRAKSDEVASALTGAIANIQTELPDLDLSKIEFWVLPSFHHFNGQTADAEHGTGIYIGVDGLLDYGPSNFPVIVAHELFHIYQQQMHPFNMDSSPLWKASWIEGTAAYASEVLVKGATREDALGSELVATSPAQIKNLACYAQIYWTSKNRRQVNEMINAGSHPSGEPARGGYLLGYLAAKDFMTSHTLVQLGSAPADQAEAAMKSTVARLCAT